jgi:hypothetical protein
MPEFREGGCLCGSVRFRISGEPRRAHACHCTFCQRRTGSAFAEVAYFDDENVVVVSGSGLTTYTQHSDVSGRWLRLEFCPVCGTCMFITLEVWPAVRGIHVGTLDDPSGLPIQWHIWCDSAQGTTQIPQTAERRPRGYTEADRRFTPPRADG